MLVRSGTRWMLAVTAFSALVACGGNNSQSEDAVSAGADSLLRSSDLATDSTDAAPMSDANIVAAIGLSNAAEISAGELASTKARNAEVKAFARQMVTEHRAMQKDADALATATSLAPLPPASADSMRRASAASLDSLKSMTGADFDRAYMAAQVRDHQATLARLQRFQAAAQNAELKTMLAGAIPKVQAHLDKATQIHSQLGSNTTASAAGPSGSARP